MWGCGNLIVWQFDNAVYYKYMSGLKDQTPQITAITLSHSITLTNYRIKNCFSLAAWAQTKNFPFLPRGYYHWRLSLP